MLYRFWVFVHVVGVLAFLTTHGVSIWATFRIRSERDPGRVEQLIQLSSSTVPAFYAATAVLLAGGIVAAFLGAWWDRAWLWVSIGVLVATSTAMFALARPYFRRVGFVARAMVSGSQAVSEEQFASILRSRRPIQIAVVGTGGLVVILFLMMYKPDLGFSAAQASSSASDALPLLEISASNSTFSTDALVAPSNAAFEIRFGNQDVAIPHNVAIYVDASAVEALFVGEKFEGADVRTYRVGPLEPGTYFFRCDVHTAMNGTLLAE